ncbi:MAG: flavin reductase family protein, partial [Aquabacterium sp.]
ARAVWLLAGGIGITPLITMEHRLHALGTPFELHYSAAHRSGAGFVAELQDAPWSACVHLHFKDEGARADLAALLPPFEPGRQLYTCGSLRYMDAVWAAAAAKGWPAQALHRELFSVPEAPPRKNHPFMLRLQRSGRELPVPADRSATDVLADAGVAVPVKCSDGLCGVCATPYDAAASGEVDHRDWVLSQVERQRRVVLCCSRVNEPDGVLALDL